MSEPSDSAGSAAERLANLRAELEALDCDAAELDQRMAALNAVLAFLHDVDIPRPALEPLLHLLAALQGLRDGHALDPLLVRQNETGRAPLSVQEQRERGACIVAVEVLAAAGWSLERAARHVARCLGTRRPLLRNASAARKAEPWRRIVKWREAIGTGEYPVMESVVASARRHDFTTMTAVPAERRVNDVLRAYGLTRPSKKAPS